MWDSFLKSLETEGGKLVVLLFMLTFLCGISVYMLISGHTPQETGRALLTSAISSLLGILYGYLKAGSVSKG
jgi:hypothetical protein